MNTFTSVQRLTLRFGLWASVMLVATFAVSTVTRYAFVVPLLWIPSMMFAVSRQVESGIKL